MKFRLFAAITFGIFSFTGCGNEEASREISTGENLTVTGDMNNDFVPIFNGTDLTGWDGDSRFWRVENRAIVGETNSDNLTEINTFLIWEEDEPADFEIQFRYRFVIVSDDEYGNSGIQIRSERFVNQDFSESDYAVRGYQPDMAISDWIPGILYEEAERAILARRGQKVLIDSDGEMHEERFAEEDALGQYITHTDWNDYHVYANKDTIRTTINDQLMHEVIDQSPDARQEGIIAFQVHSGPPMRIEIRDVELKLLD